MYQVHIIIATYKHINGTAYIFEYIIFLMLMAESENVLKNDIQLTNM